MLNLILRMFFLCLGALLAFDALLPTATYAVNIIRHDVSSLMKGRSSSYKVHFDNVRYLLAM